MVVFFVVKKMKEAEYCMKRKCKRCPINKECEWANNSVEEIENPFAKLIKEWMEKHDK